MSGQKACRDTNTAPRASGTETNEFINSAQRLSDGGKKAVKPQKWRFSVEACVRIIRPSQWTLVRAGASVPGELATI
jgi:hypothetical protein